MVSYPADPLIILHTTTKSNRYRLGLVVTIARGCALPVAPLAAPSSGMLSWPQSLFENRIPRRMEPVPIVGDRLFVLATLARMARVRRISALRSSRLLQVEGAGQGGERWEEDYHKR